jgi:arabinogalactan oligomer/maltooligosaccharide transport system permease protein
MARTTLTAEQTAAAPGQAVVGRSTERRDRYLTVLAYVGPAMIGILIFSIGPILYNVFLSFTNRNTFHFPPAADFFGPTRTGAYTFIGLDNYFRLFWDSRSSTFNADFFTVMGNTLLYTIVCVALFFITGLALALLLNSPYIQIKGIYRTLMILPWAAPAVITAPIWRFFFNYDFGPINQILRIAGVTQPPNWLGEPFWSYFGVVLVNLWMSYPFFMFIILGGLQSVPNELYEAARVDGAGFWVQLFQITLPLIRPAVLPAVVLSSITTFQMFNTVWIITKGGPFTSVARPGATEFVMIYGYNQGIVQNNYGLMSAFAVVVFVLLFIATVANLRTTKITKGAYE